MMKSPLQEKDGDVKVAATKKKGTNIFGSPLEIARKSRSDDRDS